MDRLPTERALEAFLLGFSATRSFTKPYEVHRLAESVWMMADAPGTKPPGRNPEFVAVDTVPEAVLAEIGRQGVERHALCILINTAHDLDKNVAAYKAKGYRYAGHEPLFVLNTADRAEFESIPTRRIVSSADAAAVAKAARSRQILPRHLVESDSDCRLYAAFEGDMPIGWVRSIRTHSDCAWVSNMFVSPEYRRRGIGRTLLSAMLADDARYGVRWSVLLASLAGSLLYPHLGYRRQGLLLIFTPIRSK